MPEAQLSAQRIEVTPLFGGEQRSKYLPGVTALVAALEEVAELAEQFAGAESVAWVGPPEKEPAHAETVDC